MNLFFHLSEGKFDEVYNALAKAHPHMRVYKKDDIPSRLHYKHSRRIQPILAVADGGWEILQNNSDHFPSKYSFIPLTYSIDMFKIRQNI